MDIFTILGLVVSLGGVLGGMILEGGHPSALLQVTAFMIVIIGSLGATMVATLPSDMPFAIKALKRALLGVKYDFHGLMEKILELANLARREGLLALETEVAAAGDPFLQKGIQLVADGLDQETIKDMLETELDFVASRHAACSGMLDSMGGFAPTMGIIGTVMGLIALLSSLGGNIDEMGKGIAVAFVATLYGVASANLLWLPLGSKLKRKSEQELLMREVMIAGIISIQAGDNPQIVEEKLKSYLSPDTRKQIARGGKAAEPAKGKK